MTGAHSGHRRGDGGAAPVVLAQVTWLLCVQFLPVYHPSEEEKKDPALYASNVRRVMAQ